MLERDFDEIPGLYFSIRMLIADPPYIASAADGKRVSLTGNVFYEFRGERILEVWSVLDKAAIEAQL